MKASAQRLWPTALSEQTILRIIFAPFGTGGDLLRQRVRPRGIFFSKSTPAEDTRPRAIGLRGGQVRHRLAKYQRRRNGPPGCQNALLCCQVGKPAWYGAASLREAWQNSWLTPPRLRSLIGLHERSAPRGVFGDACRGRNG
ncbi:MAG: hypothetical protein QOE88_2187 [Verrucomicrobiota bacterium]|nr:hypothetical protein [Verrucomicrobiota bacterium]